MNVPFFSKAWKINLATPLLLICKCIQMYIPEKKLRHLHQILTVRNFYLKKRKKSTRKISFSMLDIVTNCYNSPYSLKVIYKMFNKFKI